MAEHFSVPVPGRLSISAVMSSTRTIQRTSIFIYAPGAGSNIQDPFGQLLADVLNASGITVVRFQFPYMEQGKRAPDPPSILEATWNAVIDEFRHFEQRLIIGGRSMGGRIASQVAAQGNDIEALALFAYPLHPPGRPQNRRDEHFGAISVPVLFCSGTRDVFASPDEIRAAVTKIPAAALHLLKDADHGFSVPKSTGRSQADVRKEAANALLEFLSVRIPDGVG